MSDICAACGMPRSEHIPPNIIHRFEPPPGNGWERDGNTWVKQGIRYGVRTNVPFYEGKYVVCCAESDNVILFCMGYDFDNDDMECMVFDTAAKAFAVCEALSVRL